MKAIICWVFVAIVASSGISVAQSKEKLLGAWHLVRIETGALNEKSNATPQPEGMLVYTPDGHISVQLMYPESAGALSNEYVHDGYEASFGTYDIDERKHTVTHHVMASNTRHLLVGKDLPRSFQITDDGLLIIRPVRADEHWSVTWKHY